MRKEDLFKLELGTYSLSDNIYNYILQVSLTTENERIYRIIEKGSLNSNSIALFEETKQYEGDGSEYKSLTALASIGGLTLHSDNTFEILNRLSIVTDNK